MIEHLFSSPLYSAKLEKHQENKNKFVPLLYDDIAQVEDKNKHDDWWSCNSYQTFLRGYGQEELEGQMFEHVDNYMNELGYSAITYKIESWFNMYGPNQYQEEHFHLPNLISGFISAAIIFISFVFFSMTKLYLHTLVVAQYRTEVITIPISIIIFPMLNIY